MILRRHADYKIGSARQRIKHFAVGELNYGKHPAYEEMLDLTSNDPLCNGFPPSKPFITKCLIIKSRRPFVLHLKGKIERSRVKNR